MMLRKSLVKICHRKKQQNKILFIFFFLTVLIGKKFEL